jgi:hypothetical protein
MLENCRFWAIFMGIFLCKKALIVITSKHLIPLGFWNCEV